MALPIQPTPILKGKVAREFENRINRDLAHPVELKDTPKLEQARKSVKEYAFKRQK